MGLPAVDRPRPGSGLGQTRGQVETDSLLLCHNLRATISVKPPPLAAELINSIMTFDTSWKFALRSNPEPGSRIP